MGLFDIPANEEQKETLRYKETDQIRRDIIAAACLGPCRKLNRDLLRLRTLPSVPRTQLETTEQNLWKCVNDFAVQFEQNEGSWGSAVVLTPSEEELERRSSPQIKSAIKFGANLPFVGGNTGDVFYFERYSGRTSWTRPKILETIIEEGKLGSSMESQDYEPVFDCEFLQINFLTCINSSKAKISGCTMEMDKLMRCMRAKVMQKK